MSRDEEKRRAAGRAIAHVEDGMVVGVGTGSTVAFFIEALAARRHDIEGAVSSSDQSTRLLTERGIRVLELNATGDLELYVDGADECDPHRRLIKGGGGALMREKIIAAASRRFVCLIDSGKRVDVLGNFPLPIEVIPMARSYVGRQIVARGGTPVWRENYLTDNGNAVIDAHGWSIVDPVGLERELGAIAGVVCVGLFAARPADIVYCGDQTL